MYGLVFDMDGVLGDTEAIVCRATIRAFEEAHGVTMKPEDFTPYIGTGAVRYVEGPAEKYGLSIDTDAMVALRQQYFFETLRSGVDISFAGAHTLIDLVHGSSDWKLAIATSSPGEDSVEVLKAARVDINKFDAWVHGDMITHKKPHPEIYQRAARELGIAPAKCVAVEDAITGVASAKAAGMAVVAITNSFPAERLDAADRIIGSLKELNLLALERLVS